MQNPYNRNFKTVVKETKPELNKCRDSTSLTI